VVNELSIPDGGCVADLCGNIWPPGLARNYGLETVGPVFRFKDGEVKVAEGYTWYRENPHEEGAIFEPQRYYDQGQPIVRQPMQTFSVHSVFNCWRLLPCVWTDADASVVNITQGVNHRWMPLSFQHEGNVTRIAEGGTRVVAGKDPAWMPDIIPDTLKALRTSSASGGLGGPLGIIIGLLALTCQEGETSRVFNERKWHRYEWHGRRHRDAGKSSHLALSYTRRPDRKARAPS